MAARYGAVRNRGPALIAARRLLRVARLGARPIAVAMAITMPALDELGVDLVLTVEAFAVIAIVREGHELFKLLAEADARWPFVEVKHVVDGPLGLNIDEFEFAAPQANEGARIDLRLFAQAVNGG